MKAYVITINGLAHSEQCADRCIRSAETFDLAVERFPATNRYDALSILSAEALTLDTQRYARIADEPIGHRRQNDQGNWHLTTPEVGCFLSHFRLWQRCAARSEPIMIFEHDARLLASPPPLIPTFLAVSFRETSYSGAVGYLITPDASRALIEEARTSGIQPADEMLWHTVLEPDRIAYCDPPVVSCDDDGVSTIQYSRSDSQHNRILKVDPWVDFVAGDVSTSQETSGD